jgi:hypothetical protein
MDARRIVIVGRFGRRLFWCALGATLALGPGAASAQDSGQTPCLKAPQIPNCENQPNNFPQSFQPLAVHGWSIPCTGDHPYYYPFSGGFMVVDPDNCWSAIKEPGSSAKAFIGKFTNNCLNGGEKIPH